MVEKVPPNSGQKSPLYRDLYRESPPQKGAVSPPKTHFWGKSLAFSKNRQIDDLVAEIGENWSGEISGSGGGSPGTPILHPRKFVYFSAFSATRSSILPHFLGPRKTPIFGPPQIRVFRYQLVIFTPQKSRFLTISGKKSGFFPIFRKLFPLFGQRKKHGCNYLGMARLGGRGHAFFCEFQDIFFALLREGVKKNFVQVDHLLYGIYEVPGKFSQLFRFPMRRPSFADFALFCQKSGFLPPNLRS